MAGAQKQKNTQSKKDMFRLIAEIEILKVSLYYWIAY